MFSSPYTHRVFAFILTLVVGVVMGLHPFVPHEHGGEHIAGVSFVAAHTGVSEREEGEVMSFVPLLFVALVFAMPKLGFALKQRGFQHVDIPLRISLLSLLARGIMHTKCHE